jgi:hypothetical protein
MCISEHDEQAALCQWLDLTYPDVLYWATPNGAHLAGNARQRAAKMNKLKAEGFLPGVADIFIAEPRGKWHGLFVEMKARGGTLTENQKWFLSEVARRGYMDAVCYGFDDARGIVEDYLERKR